MRDYRKDLDGLAWWMMPSVIWFDMMIIALQAAIVAHAALHEVKPPRTDGSPTGAKDGNRIQQAEARLLPRRAG